MRQPSSSRQRTVLGISFLLLAGLMLLVGWVFWSGAHEPLVARNQFDSADIAECAALSDALLAGFPDQMSTFQRALEQLPDPDRLVFYRIDRTMPDGSEIRRERVYGSWQEDGAVWRWDAEATVGRVRFTAEGESPEQPALQYYRADESTRVFVILLER